MTDIRYALRQLRKTPTFLLVAILTLALGIGANVAVFSIMNAILFNPTGIPHAENLVALRAKYRMGDLENIGISPPDFADAVQGKNTFTSAAVMVSADFNYSDNRTIPQRLIGAKVTWQWFDVFWAHPHLGRVFRPEEDQPNADHEVVLAYSTWKKRFGSDPSIVGQTLLLNQESFQVIGVMGPEFAWPNEAELWVPLGLPPGEYFDKQYRHNEFLLGVARLRAGVNLEQANAYLERKAAENIAAEGTSSISQASGWGMFSVPLVQFVAGNLRKPLLILLAAVATILLIVCANIAGLELARASGRQREVSIQIALGAGRSRLVRQALLESFVLSFCGVAIGLILARSTIPLVLLLAPEAVVQNLSVPMGREVLIFVIGVGVFCVLLCGTAPAWQMSHARWFHTLQESGRSETAGRARQRFRSALVVGEIALAMLLLVGAGLLVRSLEKIEQLDTGFEASGLMSGVLSLPNYIYKNAAQQVAFFTAADERLKNMPGITSVAFADTLPFMGAGSAGSFSVIGRTLPPGDPGPHGNIRFVSPDYFSTLRIPVLNGRVFTPEDRLNTEKVTVIDETLRRQYWPNEDPIGQHISLRFANPQPLTIVGVVRHAKRSSLEADTSEGFYYFPIAQAPQSTAAVVVRSGKRSPANLASAIRSAIRDVDPSLPVYDMKTMEQRVDDSMIGRRFLVILLSIFASLALLLSALGLYGVINYGVKLRTRELGIRMALGAERGDVLRLVLGEGLRLAVFGLVLGLMATLLVGRTLSTLLYRISLFNPLTLFVTSLLLAWTVLLASYVPARRAAALDPMRTLREE